MVTGSECQQSKHHNMEIMSERMVASIDINPVFRLMCSIMTLHTSITVGHAYREIIQL